jgi:hypothetical protein
VIVELATVAAVLYCLSADPAVLQNARPKVCPPFIACGVDVVMVVPVAVCIAVNQWARDVPN